MLIVLINIVCKHRTYSMYSYLKVCIKLRIEYVFTPRRGGGGGGGGGTLIFSCIHRLWSLLGFKFLISIF